MTTQQNIARERIERAERDFQPQQPKWSFKNLMNSFNQPRQQPPYPQTQQQPRQFSPEEIMILKQARQQPQPRQLQPQQFQSQDPTRGGTRITLMQGGKLAHRLKIWNSNPY